MGIHYGAPGGERRGDRTETVTWRGGCPAYPRYAGHDIGNRADRKRIGRAYTSGEFIRASWQSGIGAVPLGFTTYATNAIESTWRVLKGLFDKGFRYQNVAQLIIKIHRAITSRMQAGQYVDLHNMIENPPPWLLDHAGTRRDGDDVKQFSSITVCTRRPGRIWRHRARFILQPVFKQSRFTGNQEKILAVKTIGDVFHKQYV